MSAKKTNNEEVREKSLADNDIHSIRVYQSVTFNKKNETYFTTVSTTNRAGTIITINEKYNGVEIKSENDHIFVPFTNISCVYFNSKLRLEQANAAKSMKTSNNGIRAAEISRPN